MDGLTADELIVVEVLGLLADAGSGFCPKKHQETSYSAVENHAAPEDTTVSDKNQQPDSPVSPAYNSCTVCGKSFQSHQALGGHMTMHRVKIHADGGRRNPAAATGRVHECAVCHDRFPTGQALGGHKRKHFQGPPIIREAANPFKRVALESSHGCRAAAPTLKIRFKLSSHKSGADQDIARTVVS